MIVTEPEVRPTSRGHLIPHLYAALRIVANVDCDHRDVVVRVFSRAAR